MNPSIQELVDGFIAYKLHNQGRSQRTVELYRLVLGRFETFLEGRDPLRTTSDEVLLFSGLWLHKHGINPVNRHTYVSSIREFYKWLVTTRRISVSPAAEVPHPTIGRKLPRLITLANAEKLMWEPDVNSFVGLRDCAMLGLLLGCGLRVSGLVSLNVGNITEDAIAGERRLILRVREKGDRERRIPIPPEAALMLRVYLDHPRLKEIDRVLSNGDLVLFVSTRDQHCPAHEYHGERRRLRRGAIQELLLRYGERAGVPKEQLHPHALRHLFGTELAEEDVDLLVRQKLMGHADPKSTEIYTTLALRKLAKESDRANPLAKMRTPVSEILRRLKR